ncbi:branched-chain amino acid transport system II carrier protein [Flavonifractor sp. An82]|uniref:branched-chain amino acid transport system II carrier protein n=1 Tax=Flavonifractor sp. An82 TaxID=1965660 RepID=UPI000B36C66A|nr:branched-chain amino acid transport system II carrier protein [Flavonifractor sp. An82]OUN20661.1 branched-chain amino acid transport system II carrier protein [Flavonifractor sp. An82]
MQLKGKNLLLVGFTLFSMFFGAGNLIFPPGIAAQAGTATWPAFVGLAISAVGLPVLGVVAVARSGGLDTLCSRVHPLFSMAFTIAAYLAIGPCLAIPRTATTSFEMAIPPFAGPDAPLSLFRLIYSLVFFSAALFIALRPEKLTDRLGKIMCPILVVLIVVTFAGCLVNPLSGYGAASGDYVTHPVVKGFLEGYQTMDTIAALAFGIVIAVNIRARGVKEESAVVKGTIRSGIIAGVMLLIVYAMLAHIGALSGGAIPNPTDGAAALTNVVGLLFGPVGNALLAAIFIIACFNVCVGLISSCGEFFHKLFPKLSYRGWAVLFAVVSMVISNAGLAQIISVSAPVLGVLYPMAIVLIALSFFQRWLEGRRLVYPVSILFTGVASLLYALQSAGLPLDFLDAVPLASIDLGWVLPAVAGILLGLLLSGRKQTA